MCATDRATDGGGVWRGVAAVSYGPFRVVAWREPGCGWSAAASDVDGAFTAGDSLAELERNVRESIAVMLDLPRGAEDDMSIDLHASMDASGPD